MKEFRFCAAADFHLGMRFSSYPSVQKELIRARFSALQRVVEQANIEECALLVIAGDLFDRINIPENEADETAAILDGFQGDCIALLPGNHDYFSAAEGGVWKKLAKRWPDTLLFLEEQRKYPLKEYNLPVVIYAGPCTSRHSREHALSWIDTQEQRDEGIFHLGVAHGSVEGISPDLTKRYFPMDRKRLETFGLDLWVIGHTHVPFPEREEAVSNIIVPGTPEPVGFDYNYNGSAWIVTVKDREDLTKKRFPAGSYRFLRLEREVHSADELEQTVREISRLADPALLLQLKLTGTLPKHELLLLGPAMDELVPQFFHMDSDTGGVKPKITPVEIGNEFREGTFPHTLLTRLAEADDTEALQRAYSMLEEMKK